MNYILENLSSMDLIDVRPRLTGEFFSVFDEVSREKNVYCGLNNGPFLVISSTMYDVGPREEVSVLRLRDKVEMPKVSKTTSMEGVCSRIEMLSVEISNINYVSGIRFEYGEAEFLIFGADRPFYVTSGTNREKLAASMEREFEEYASVAYK